MFKYLQILYECFNLINLSQTERIITTTNLVICCICRVKQYLILIMKLNNRCHQRLSSSPERRLL